MRRTRSRHVGTSVLSGATTPNRNGLVIALNPRTRAAVRPVTRHVADCDLLPTPSNAAATPKSSMNAVNRPVGSLSECATAILALMLARYPSVERFIRWYPAQIARIEAGELAIP